MVDAGNHAKINSRQSASCLVLYHIITTRYTLVQSAVLRSHVVCLSVCLSVCNVGEL